MIGLRVAMLGLMACALGAAQPPASPEAAPAPELDPPSAASAPTSGPASEPAPSGVIIELTTLDGVLLRGELLSVGPALSVRTDRDGAPENVDFSWDELLLVTIVADPAVSAEPPLRPATPAEAAPAFRWTLSDGTEFRGRATGRDDGGTRVEIRDGQVAIVPLGALQSIERVSPDDKSAEKLAELRQPRPAGGEDSAARDDTAIALRGSGPVVLRGSVRAIDAKGVQFAWNQRELPLAWDKLAGVFLARPEPRRGTARAVTTDGEVFVGAPSGGDGRRLLLKSTIFRDLELEWRALQRIEIRSDKLVFLSDIPAQSYDFEPLFGSRWEYARDQSLTAGPIVLADRNFAKGVVLHANASLTFDIRAGFRQFAATVGVLDEYAAQGCATVRIVGDNRVLWEAARVRGGEKPQDVLVDVDGVRQLSLVVQRGENLDIGDHVAFALARLIR